MLCYIVAPWLIENSVHIVVPGRLMIVVSVLLVDDVGIVVVEVTTNSIARTRNGFLMKSLVTFAGIVAMLKCNAIYCGSRLTKRSPLRRSRYRLPVRIVLIADT